MSQEIIAVLNYYKSTRKLNFNSKYRIEYFRIAVFSMQCGRLQAQFLVGAFAYITQMYITKYLLMQYILMQYKHMQQEKERVVEGRVVGITCILGASYFYLGQKAQVESEFELSFPIEKLSLRTRNFSYSSPKKVRVRA